MIVAVSALTGAGVANLLTGKDTCEAPPPAGSFGAQGLTPDALAKKQAAYDDCRRRRGGSGSGGGGASGGGGKTNTVVSRAGFGSHGSGGG